MHRAGMIRKRGLKLEGFKIKEAVLLLPKEECPASRSRVDATPSASSTAAARSRTWHREDKTRKENKTKRERLPVLRREAG
jgi:hypothetical protein